jgi:hypothetical protein
LTRMAPVRESRSGWMSLAGCRADEARGSGSRNRIGEVAK